MTLDLSRYLIFFKSNNLIRFIQSDIVFIALTLFAQYVLHIILFSSHEDCHKHGHTIRLLSDQVHQILSDQINTSVW